MEDQLKIIRKPLSQRENIISSDVADAIQALVQGSPHFGKVPAAFAILSKPQIKETDITIKLVEIAHTDEDGIALPILPINRSGLIDKFSNRLFNTAVMQAGYKRYEKRSNWPVVPVTPFFFSQVFSNGDVSDVLDAMSDYEVLHSLPKRRGRIKADSADEYVVNPDARPGDDPFVHPGDVAGVIVFPANSRAPLLRSWLERKVKVTSGAQLSTVASLEHARPGSAGIENLKEHLKPLRSSFTRALPKPKAK